jgi:hypothetical protein
MMALTVILQGRLLKAGSDHPPNPSSTGPNRFLRKRHLYGIFNLI